MYTKPVSFCLPDLILHKVYPRLGSTVLVHPTYSPSLLCPHQTHKLKKKFKWQDLIAKLQIIWKIKAVSTPKIHQCYKNICQLEFHGWTSGYRIQKKIINFIKEIEEFIYDTKKYLSDLGKKHLRYVQENINKLLKEMTRRT